MKLYRAFVRYLSEMALVLREWRKQQRVERKRERKRRRRAERTREGEGAREQTAASPAPIAPSGTTGDPALDATLRELDQAQVEMKGLIAAWGVPPVVRPGAASPGSPDLLSGGAPTPPEKTEAAA